MERKEYTEGRSEGGCVAYGKSTSRPALIYTGISEQKFPVDHIKMPVATVEQLII